MCFILLGGKPPRSPALFNHPYRFRLSLFLQKCFILLGGKPPRPPTLFNHPYRFRLKSVPLKSILSVSRKVCIFRLWSIEEKTLYLMPFTHLSCNICNNFITPKKNNKLGGGVDPPDPPCSLNIPIDLRLNLFLFHG